FQHFIVPHAAGWQIRAPNIRQRRLGPRVLLGIVVLPLDAHGAVVTDAVQFDHNLLDAVGITGRPGGDEVPAVEAMAHRPMPAEQASAGVLANDLDALDVRTVDPLAEL